MSCHLFGLNSFSFFSFECKCLCLCICHGLNMALDLQCSFGLHEHSCTHWLSETPHSAFRNPHPPAAFGLIYDGTFGHPRCFRRYLFVTPLASAIYFHQHLTSFLVPSSILRSLLAYRLYPFSVGILPLPIEPWFKDRGEVFYKNFKKCKDLLKIHPYSTLSPWDGWPLLTVETRLKLR